MDFYKYHVFFCVNQRAAGESCCMDFNSQRMRDYMKEKTKELGMHHEGGVRVNMAGCLGRCESGPTMVVYPDGIWYTYVDQADIDEIIQMHLINGQIVDRLKI